MGVVPIRSGWVRGALVDAEARSAQVDPRAHPTMRKAAYFSRKRCSDPLVAQSSGA
jgi:hypothetical protein